MPKQVIEAGGSPNPATPGAPGSPAPGSPGAPAGAPGAPAPVDGTGATVADGGMGLTDPNAVPGAALVGSAHVTKAVSGALGWVATAVFAVALGIVL